MGQDWVVWMMDTYTTISRVRKLWPILPSNRIYANLDLDIGQNIFKQRLTQLLIRSLSAGLYLFDRNLTRSPRNPSLNWRVWDPKLRTVSYDP